MNTESIINGIVAKRDALNYAESKENHDIWDKILDLEEQMRNLGPRLDNMFKVAEALTDNGFWLGGRSKSTYKQEAPDFITDHIDHRIGFFVNHPYLDAPGRNFTLLGYFGKANGGACGDDDLKIDRNGNTLRWDFTRYASNDPRYKDLRSRYLDGLTRVVEQFDKFEADFYEYAKNPVPRSQRI